MDLKPSAEKRSNLKSTIPVTDLEQRNDDEKTMQKMRQIHKKLNEYVRNLEDLYSEDNDEVEGNDDVTAESSPMVGPFSSFLSTCHSAASAMDITINAEHKILESLYQWYWKEVQLLEQLHEEDSTTGDSSPASPVILDQSIANIFHKLDKMKTHLYNLLKNVAKVSLPGRGPMPVQMEREKNESRAQGYVTPGIKSESSDHEAQNVVTGLQKILTSRDSCSNKEIEKIIEEVENKITSQNSEYKKLEKEHEDAKHTYQKMKSQYQALLEEKIIIENELRKIVKLRREQPSAGASLPSYDQIQSIQKIIEERDFSKVLDPRDKDQRFKKETLSPISPDDVVNLQHETSPSQAEAEDSTQEKGNIVNKKKQKVKSAKGRERRPSTTSRKTTPEILADNVASQIKQLPVFPEIKPADVSHTEDTIQDESTEKKEKRRKHSVAEKGKSKSYVSHETQRRSSGQSSRRQSVSTKQKPTVLPITEPKTKEEEEQNTPEKTQVLDNSTEKQMEMKSTVDNSLLVPSAVNPEVDQSLSSDSDPQRTEENNQDRYSSDFPKQNINTMYKLSDQSTEEPEMTHKGPTEKTLKSNLVSESLLPSSVGKLNCHIKSIQAPMPEKIREINSQLQYSESIDHQPVPVGDLWMTTLPNESFITAQESVQNNKINPQHQISGDVESQQVLVEETQMLLAATTTTKAQMALTSSIAAVSSQQQILRNENGCQVSDAQTTKYTTTISTTQTPIPPETVSQQSFKDECENQLVFFRDPEKTPSSTAIITTQPPVPLEKSETVPQQQFSGVCKSQQVLKEESEKTQLSTTGNTRSERPEAPSFKKLLLKLDFPKDNENQLYSPGNTQKIHLFVKPRTRPMQIPTQIKFRRPFFRDGETQANVLWEHGKAPSYTAPVPTQTSVLHNLRVDGSKLLHLRNYEIQHDLPVEAEKIPSSGTVTSQVSVASIERNSSCPFISLGNPVETNFSTPPAKTSFFPSLKMRDLPYCFVTDKEILMYSWSAQMSCPHFTKRQVLSLLGSEKKHYFLATCRDAKSPSDPLLPGCQDIGIRYSSGYLHSNIREEEKIDYDHLIVYDRHFMQNCHNLLCIQGKNIIPVPHPTGIKKLRSRITAKFYPTSLAAKTTDRFGKSARKYSTAPILLVNGVQRDLGTYYRSIPLAKWRQPVLRKLKSLRKKRRAQRANILKRDS